MAMTPMTNLAPFTDSIPLLDDPELLRARARDEGYLFFEQLVEREAVVNVRRQILDVCERHGWLAKGTPLMDGVVSSELSVVEGGDPRWQAFYCDVLKIRDFHALAVHPSLIGMFGKVFNEDVLPHSRNICRAMFPNSATFSTPPHQDHFYIGGTEETWTNWMPLGDCPVELGSLAVAPGSHRQGIYEVHEAQGAGGRAVSVEEDEAWVGGDISCGDVLILHSHAIHQGRDNVTGNLLRLSVDYRYQPRSHPVRADSMLPHMGWLSWDDIYADWDDEDPLKYYWRDWNLKVVENS